MTTEVTISSKSPNHNPIRVRILQIDKNVLNAAIAKVMADHAEAVNMAHADPNPALTVKHTADSFVTSYTLQVGDACVPTYVHPYSVIVIDEITE